MPITIPINGTSYQIIEDGNIKNAAGAVVGSWDGVSNPNSLNYTLTGVAGSPSGSVPLAFSFDPNNQLTITVAAAPAGPVAGAAAPAAVVPAAGPLPGRMATLRNSYIEYILLDSTGNDQKGFAITGTFSMSQDLTKFEITSLPAFQTIITGVPGKKSLTAKPSTNNVADRMTFSAITKNAFGNFPAIIQFDGTWSLDKDGMLEFHVPSTSGSVTSTTTAITITQNWKGGSAGIEILHGPDSVADVTGIIIRAEFNWDKNGSCNITLGYSKKTGFSASVSLNSTQSFAGGTLKIQGNLSIGAGSFKLDLSADYQWNANNDLQFTVTGNGHSYNMTIGGTFTVGADLSVTFSLQYSTAPAGGLTLSLTFKSGTTQLASFQLFCANHKITFKANLAFQAAWVIGPSGPQFLPISS